MHVSCRSCWPLSSQTALPAHADRVDHADVEAEGKDAGRPLRAPSLDPREVHLADLRQITFGGENAEAYWSSDSRGSSSSSTDPPQGCDQIFRPSRRRRARDPGLDRQGAHHLLLLHGPAATSSTRRPTPPARRARRRPTCRRATSGRSTTSTTSTATPTARTRRLTDKPGYDAETTVCPKDGSLIFTSTRDGDLELYRMDADGGNVGS